MSDLFHLIKSLADAGYGHEDIAVKAGCHWRQVRHYLRDRYVKHGMPTLRVPDRAREEARQATVCAATSPVLRSNPGGSLTLAGEPPLPADIGRSHAQMAAGQGRVSPHHHG